MAGIGFRLQYLLKKDTFLAVAQAYLYSALIVAGPWLLSVFGLGLIGLIATRLVDQAELVVFRTAVVYTYAGTLVLTGAFQMNTTRYVADRLYLGDVSALLPCFHWVGGWTVVLTGLTGGVFFWLAGLTPAQALGAALMFQAVALTWIGMIFLSAARDYLAIVRAFAAGYALSVAGALGLAGRWGLAGLIWGFAAGQLLMAIWLTVRIRAEFPSARRSEPAVVGHWRKLPLLALIGLCYNLGLWVDKLCFWAGPTGECVRGWFYISPHYDTALFFGYLTMVPAMAVFLIRVETGFYKHYAAFYAAITQGAGLGTLREEKAALVAALRLSAERLLKIQGALSLACYAAVPNLLPRLGLTPDLAPLLRIAILAAFIQALLLVGMVILLYFDWQYETAVLAFFFLGLNAALTQLSLRLPELFHGWGYLLACLICLLFCLAIMEEKLGKLEYETFCKQPLTV